MFVLIKELLSYNDLKYDTHEKNPFDSQNSPPSIKRYAERQFYIVNK